MTDDDANDSTGYVNQFTFQARSLCYTNGFQRTPRDMRDLLVIYSKHVYIIRYSEKQSLHVYVLKQLQLVL